MHQRMPHSVHLDQESSPIPVHFGAHLRLLRDRHGVEQRTVVDHLPGWQQASYSKVEKGTRAPLFDQLARIYLALKKAGVQFTIQDRDYFFLLARDLLESRQRRHAHQSEEEWSELYTQLMTIDGLLGTREYSSVHAPTQKVHVGQTPRLEIGHLLGREAWIVSGMDLIARATQKVVVLLGGPGCGKTSELHRFAHRFSQQIPRYAVVVSSPAPIQLGRLDPEDVLERLLGDIVSGVGPAYATMPTSSMQSRVDYALDILAKADRPVILAIDNAEHIFNEQGSMYTVWQLFLTQFAQAGHRATLILASQEWPASAFLVESQLITTIDVPLLSPSEGRQLLQSLGLRSVPAELLDRAVAAVGRVPVCLEWLVRLVREPFLRTEWAEFEEVDESAVLARLLDDPAIFDGAVARRVQPLLNRVIKRLSDQAAAALQDLAVSPVPLGSPALKALYQSPQMLRELREASLLVAYPQRVQLLPMVAAQMRKRLSAEQVSAAEERLIHALFTWLKTGIPNTQEQGAVFTELACFLVRRYRFLAAAELILYHGWLSFRVGQIQRLARLVQQMLAAHPWNSPETEKEAESGALLLHYYLASYYGEIIDTNKRHEDYERLYTWITTSQVNVEPLMEVHVVDHLMLFHTNADQYEEAERLLGSCFARLARAVASDEELHATLVSKQASLYGEWCGYAESQGHMQEARRKRLQTIDAYEQSLHILQRAEQEKGGDPLQYETIKKKQASILNNLAYHLNKAGHFAEAFRRVTACIELKEQGYAEPDSLAASYGEMSQILAALGSFEEALRFDERARSEIGRSADAGDALSQANRWIYQVDQARLYLLLGRVEEAEPLLRDALSIQTERRRIYKVFAQEALTEIEQAKSASPDGQFQLDWRWVHRYRTLSAYDAYWWWSPAGPFTDDEQDEWEKLFHLNMDEAAKDHLRELLLQAREREFSVARVERREPDLSYPAIDIAEVRQRIADFLQLDAAIAAQEPNVVVRRLYRGAIEDEVCFLRLIEATADKSNDRFWEQMQLLYPPTTKEEMHYALEQVKQVLLQGLQVPKSEPTNEFERGRYEATQLACQRAIEILHDQFHITFDLSEEPSGSFGKKYSPSEEIPLISAEGAKRFFEAVLDAQGYTGWRITLDPNVTGPRVESGLRQVFLPAESIPLDELREYVSHELAGHVARSIAGEQSLLGLLGMGTKGYLVTEEGVADYYERQATARYGDLAAADDSGIWLGTLAIGLACGVAGPPQTFSSLLAFFESFLLAYRLLWRDDEDRDQASRRARRNAFTRCLRTFRGVPDLSRSGICNTKDVVYLRGRWLIDQKIAQDTTILDRLAVGKIASELLPEIDQLGLLPPASSLRTMIDHPDLDAYILSFERVDGDSHERESL